MSILFLLSGLGVINGLLVSIYLLFRKERTVSETYFAGLLLALSIRIGKSVYFYFNEEVDLLILQFGLSACTFIGPFFYLYVKTLSTQEKSFKKLDLVLLASILIIIVGVGLQFPYSAYPEIWNGYIVYGIYSVWALYTFFGLYYSAKILDGFSFSLKGVTADQQYFLIIVTAVLFITIAYQAALFIGFTYIWAALVFSAAFYFLLARALFSRKPVIPKTPNTPIEDAAVLLKKVNKLMISEKPYLNQTLKLNELATAAGMSRNILSRILNEEYKEGFSNYIKKYRVDEAKQLIHSRPELSIEGIGYESGFKSKSAFFEAFKKVSGQTPSEYKKSL